MKNTLRGIFLILLISALLLSFAACGGDAEIKDTTAPITDAPVTDAPKNIPTAKDRFYIIRDSVLGSSEGINAAIDHLKLAIYEVYGINAKEISDSEADLSLGYSILIGPTSFSESASFASQLGVKDHGYSILTDKLIVINGGISDEVLEGAESFTEEVLNYKDGEAVGDTPEIVSGSENIKKSSYGDSVVEINGIPLEEYTIAVRGRDHLETAASLQKLLGEYNGYAVPLVKTSALKGDERAVICLGTTDREAMHTLKKNYNGYRIVVSSKNGYTVGVAGSDDEYYAAAFEKFLESITREEKGDRISIALPAETYQHLDYKFTAGVAGPWTLEKETEEEIIRDGIVYKEYHYKDEDGDPHIANVLYIDGDKYSFAYGKPSDGAYYQELTKQMQAGIDRGLNVVAAINGDRWDSDGAFRGLSINNGELITKGKYNNPYFALTKDRELMIGLKGQSDSIKNLLHAVGGDYLLVDKGVPQHYSDISTNSHLYLSHPRTFLGLTDDGNIILVTVDGRQSHSMGATMENAAYLMFSLGAYNAISLDGGGSSTMAVKTDSGFRVMNSPSDGKERTVKNSVLIVAK